MNDNCVPFSVTISDDPTNVHSVDIEGHKEIDQIQYTKLQVINVPIDLNPSVSQ